ncbi:MAG: hypothetical protein ACC628_04700 [Pirellulaceae bacterium]
MHRREVLGMIGATAAGLTTLAGVEASSAQGHKSHAGHKMHGQFDKCAKISAACQVQCDSCFHHCAALLANGQKAHAQTMHLCVDCAEFCSTAARLVARHSSLSKAACEACAEACDKCAAQCEKFPEEEHCMACAKSCREGAKSCREMIKHLA